MGSSVSRCSDNSSSSSCALLPEEIIRGEILTRLPVKLLVRFRCVCKSWNYLLSADPDFVKSHLTRNRGVLGGGGGGSHIFRGFPYVHYPTFHPLKSIELQLGGSVNGLVCVYHRFLNPLSCIGIWNPATNHYKDIPLPPVKAFIDSGFSQLSFSIGFDHNANDFKLVCIRAIPQCPLVGLVYSCNAASWGTSTFTSTFLGPSPISQYPTIVHDRPYWYNFVGEFGDAHCYVMYFDFKDEVPKLLPSIEFVNYRTITRHMVNLRDSLAFIVYEFPETSTRLLDVYVFDERCGFWSKNYTVRLTLSRYMIFLNCFENGDLLFYSGKHLKLVSVNPETHAIDMLKSDIYVCDNSHCILLMSYSFTYIESLAFVKGMQLMHVRKVGSDVMIIDQSS